MGLALCVPSVASAANGFYVGGYGGLNFLSDVDTNSVQGNVSTSSEYDTGYALGAVAGYSFDLDQSRADGLALRTELDVGYRENSIDSIDGTGTFGNATLSGRTSNVSGDVSTFSGLANAWVDYRVGRITPYVGGGIGLANVSANGISALGVEAVDDSDTVFAYQLGTGVAYNLTEQFALTLDYSYFATSDPELTDEAGGDFEAEVASHSVMAGVRFGF